MLLRSSSCVSARLAAALTAIGCTALLAGCGNAARAEEQARAARMTLDDSAYPVGAGQSTLTGAFDLATKTLASAIPTDVLREKYTELQEMDAETLTPSEASGCDPDKVNTPSVPATEVLATKAPEAGKQQPDIADIVAARASDDETVNALIKAIRKAAQGCATFSTAGRDLGEGSYDPGEKGKTTITNQTSGAWAGLRTVATVTVTGANWKQKVVRESLVLRRGQVVVHVRVEAADQAGATARVDELMAATLANIEAATNPSSAAASGQPGGSSTAVTSAPPTGRSSQARGLEPGALEQDSQPGTDSGTGQSTSGSSTPTLTPSDATSSASPTASSSTASSSTATSTEAAEASSDAATPVTP